MNIAIPERSRQLGAGLAAVSLLGLVVLGILLAGRALLRLPGSSAEVLAVALVLCLVNVRAVHLLFPAVRNGTVLELDLPRIPCESAPKGLGALSSGARVLTHLGRDPCSFWLR
jgi:hypothetical protein